MITFIGVWRSSNNISDTKWLIGETECRSWLCFNLSHVKIWDCFMPVAMCIRYSIMWYTLLWIASNRWLSPSTPVSVIISHWNPDMLQIPVLMNNWCHHKEEINGVICYSRVVFESDISDTKWLIGETECRSWLCFKLGFFPLVFHW
jgi:hypothetical protein